MKDELQVETANHDSPLRLSRGMERMALPLLWQAIYRYIYTDKYISNVRPANFSGSDSRHISAGKLQLAINPMYMNGLHLMDGFLHCSSCESELPLPLRPRRPK
jgi:hypothetical protein